MGQSQSSITETLPDLDSVQMQVVRHAKVLSEIKSLTYEDFKACLDNLNTLSRKCIDPEGKQLIFLVKRGSDTTLLWKATVKIACIRVNPQTRRVETYKFLNLKQFLCVFKTFQSHLDTLISSETQRNLRRGSRSSLCDDNQSQMACCSNLPRSLTATIFLSALGNNSDSGSDLNSSTTSSCSHNDHVDECSICLDRSTEVILPCTHSFCTPCIEQWNVGRKTCPICSENLESMDETWVMSDIPRVEEINEKICAEFMNLTKEQ